MKKIFVILALCAVLLLPGVVFAGAQTASGDTGVTVIQNVRNLINEKTASYWEDDRDLLRYINYGLVDIASRSLCFQSTEGIVLVSGVTQYSIASTTYIGIEAVVNNSDSGVTNRAMARGNLQSMGHSKADMQTGSAKTPAEWFDWDGKLIVYPAPSYGVTGQKLTLYLYDRPTALTSSASAIPTPAAYDMALVYFVTAQAFKQLRYFNFASLYEAYYLAEMERLRQMFYQMPKETPEVSK